MELLRGFQHVTYAKHLAAQGTQKGPCARSPDNTRWPYDARHVLGLFKAPGMGQELNGQHVLPSSRGFRKGGGW